MLARLLVEPRFGFAHVAQRRPCVCPRTRDLAVTEMRGGDAAMSGRAFELGRGFVVEPRRVLEPLSSLVLDAPEPTPPQLD